MQIKYGIQMILSEQHLAFDDTDTDEAVEAEVSDARWRAFWEDQIEKQNQQTFIYTIGHSSIRYERNQYQRPEEFIRILPESGVMQHFYKDENTHAYQLNEFELHHNPETSGLTVHYEIETTREETKVILGFACFKMKLKQTRRHEKENWEMINQYELFVTDQIPLPVRLVIPLWEPVTELCALEIRSIKADDPDSYAIQRAIEIKKDIGEEALELPKGYADVLVAKNQT